MRALGAFLGLVGLLGALFAVLFLGGLASAAWEIRQERRAGKVPTRPAWDNRDKRQALGGLREQLRVSWRSKRSPLVTCWCGQGPVVYFDALDSHEVAGNGCAAWEAGSSEAIRRHDAAGGYARTPAA